MKTPKLSELFYVNDSDRKETILWTETENGGWLGRDGRNILRYLNHCEVPCAEFEAFDLVALKDIAPGTELTIHYGEEFAEEISVE